MPGGRWSEEQDLPSLGARVAPRWSVGRGGQGRGQTLLPEAGGNAGRGEEAPAAGGAGGPGRAGVFPSRGAVPTPAPAPTPARLAHQKSRLAQTKPPRLRRGRSQLSAAAMQQPTASPVSPSTAAAPAPPDTSAGSGSPGAAAPRSCGASASWGCAGSAALAMARCGRRAAAGPGGAGAGAGPGRAGGGGPGAGRCPRVTPHRLRAGAAGRARPAGRGRCRERAGGPEAAAPGPECPRPPGGTGSMPWESWATRLLSRFGKVKPAGRCCQ